MDRFQQQVIKRCIKAAFKRGLQFDSLDIDNKHPRQHYFITIIKNQEEYICQTYQGEDSYVTEDSIENLFDRFIIERKNREKGLAK